MGRLVSRLAAAPAGALARGLASAAHRAANTFEGKPDDVTVVCVKVLLLLSGRTARMAVGDVEMCADAELARSRSISERLRPIEIRQARISDPLDEAAYRRCIAAQTERTYWPGWESQRVVSVRWSTCATPRHV